MIEQVVDQDKLLALIIKDNYLKEGITFFTPENFSQQLAYINHSKGKVIQPHKHRLISRVVVYTQEVLFIKKGRLRVDFYDDNEKYLESRILSKGDTILLASGGHGFKVLEEIEMIEVKQGPYTGDNEKVRFKGIN